MNSISIYPNDLGISRFLLDFSFICLQPIYFESLSIWLLNILQIHRLHNIPAASTLTKGIIVSCLGLLQQTADWFLHPHLLPFQSSLYLAARVIFLKWKSDHVSSPLNVLYDCLCIKSRLLVTVYVTSYDTAPANLFPSWLIFYIFQSLSFPVHESRHLVASCKSFLHSLPSTLVMLGQTVK